MRDGVWGEKVVVGEQSSGVGCLRLEFLFFYFFIWSKSKYYYLYELIQELDLEIKYPIELEFELTKKDINKVDKIFTKEFNNSLDINEKINKKIIAMILKIDIIIVNQKNTLIII